MTLTGILSEMIEVVWGKVPERTDVRVLEKEAGQAVCRMYARGNVALEHGRYLTPYEANCLIDEAIASTDRAKWQ